MLSLASSPIFSGSWDHHRPAVSSPLSSSPIRASSPLSPINSNALPHQRQVQSSPIPPPKFKPAAGAGAGAGAAAVRHAGRPTRPNPVVRGREDARQARRQTFLQRVRQKADDKAWQRRDIEGQFLKNSWLANLGRLTHDAPAFSEADIEDAMAFQQETARHAHEDQVMEDGPPDEELEAMIASHEQQQPRSPTLISDDEFDELFADLMSREETSAQTQPLSSSDRMDTTDDG
ncbi:hypothetical protein CDD83_8714 [Cordyceps sp. RAO-2017]|nr:hypothetical protein CDD83_8714 [Cordyceps sp. RAO-2017]